MQITIQRKIQIEAKAAFLKEWQAALPGTVFYAGWCDHLHAAANAERLESPQEACITVGNYGYEILDTPEFFYQLVTNDKIQEKRIKKISQLAQKIRAEKVWDRSAPKGALVFN